MGNTDDDGQIHPEWTRRSFLFGATAVAVGTIAACACRSTTEVRASASLGDDSNPDLSTWEDVRAQFDADPELIHMVGMLLSTHPQSVRQTIEEHRRGFDDNPVDYLYDRWRPSEAQLDVDLDQRAMEAAGRYLDVPAAHIALTHNTTTGLAVVYNGLDLRPDQEVLTAHWNHWASEGSIQYAARRRGFSHRRARLADDLQAVTPDEIADRLVDEITPQTRVVAATWVHSDTGLKLPVGAIGRRIEELNRQRSPQNRILYCVDAVHGFGVEDADFADLHCHFYVAGCHKWLFGPRGTGIIAARHDAWQHATPTVPTFSGQFTPGRRFTPGGFHTYEYRWALPRAFEFHQQIGKTRVQNRIRELSGRIVEELDDLPHVRLITPVSPQLRSGIVVFRVDGHGPFEVVDHLRRHDIVASISSGDVRQARLAPGLLNDHSEIDAVVEALGELG